MREHAKMLELYSKMFEDCSQKVNIQREFVETMMAEGKFQPAEI